MSYRKDSRMGDEIFSTGAAIAPFVIVLMKKAMNGLTKQKTIDPSLSEKEKIKLSKSNLNNKVKFWKGTGIVCLVLEAITFLIGRASIGDATWFLIIGYFYFSNKKKLENI